MIAISYRREDSLPIAGRLYDRLQAKFGKKNVFMDFDSIPPGVDFRERIKETIEKSDLVIALIGPHWLGEQGDGSRRIDDPTDFVRLEIDYALKAKIPVIPLLIDNTQMPKPDKLPNEIEPLAFRNALPLNSGMDFHQHVDRAFSWINNLVIDKKTNGASRESLKRKVAWIKTSLAALALFVAIGIASVLYVRSSVDGKNPVDAKQERERQALAAQSLQVEAQQRMMQQQAARAKAATRALPMPTAETSPNTRRTPIEVSISPTTRSVPVVTPPPRPR
jgi:hypothetical protein